ncbi:MAG: spore maturation protein [Oscillospiraceae bacterium]|nr:spore maturation protein [Oscillospiraceae bacterium]
MSTVLSTEIIVPAVIAFVIGWAIYRKTDVFGSFVEGAKEGLRSAVSILPALCFLMTAIGMLRQSGFLEAVTDFVAPAAEKLGFPAEIIPLAVLRPFSGSGALGYYEELFQSVVPGSFVEKTASVLMGGSETTFYTLAVYYGAVGIKNSRNTVPAALFADFSAAVLSVFFVNLFLQR